MVSVLNAALISGSAPFLSPLQNTMLNGNVVTHDEFAEAYVWLYRFQHTPITHVTPALCDMLDHSIRSLYRCVSWKISQPYAPQRQQFRFFARTLSETLQVLSGMKAQCLKGRLCSDATGSYSNMQVRLQRIIRWICLLGSQQYTDLLY